jgi:hypothetical protein
MKMGRPSDCDGKIEKLAVKKGMLGLYYTIKSKEPQVFHNPFTDKSKRVECKVIDDVLRCTEFDPRTGRTKEL